MKRKLCIVLVLTFAAILCQAQDPVIFIESGDWMKIKSISGNLAKVTADVNGDFRDDIVRTTRDSIYIEIQINHGKSFKQIYSAPIEGASYTLNVADFDNDGYNDVLHSGFYFGVETFSNPGNLIDYGSGSLLDIPVYAQGSSMSDYNHDGWIDLLISHDDGSNFTLLNDQEGGFADSQYIDFTTDPTSDNSGNYSAIWIDVNGDDIQDLFISKCRVGVDDPGDPRRINMLYLNTGDEFEEQAENYQLDHGDQSWCATSGDFDNDGDQDIFLINHDSPHVLLENDNNQGFITRLDYLNGGFLENYDLEVSSADFNNDGLLDILISGVKDFLLLNQGNLNFTDNANPFGFKNASAASVGDLNSDGYPDCMISFGGPGTPSTIPDEAWINFGGDNHFLTLSLVGTQSNSSGIGSKVQIFGEWGQQTRWLNSGDAYGITNSLNIHFGLDNHTEIDSLVILWPTGLKEVFEDVHVNKHYIINEGACFEEIVNITAPMGETLDCNLSSVSVTAGQTTNSLIWNTGDTTKTINRQSPGYYFAQSKENTCTNRSNIIYVDTLTPPEIPNLNYQGEWWICAGQSVELNAGNLNNEILWSSGEADMEITADTPGAYYAMSLNQCDTINSDTFKLNWFEKQLADSLLIIDTVAELDLEYIVDGMVVWYDDSLLLNPIQNGVLLSLDVALDTCLYITQSFSAETQSFTGGESLSDLVGGAIDDLETNGEMRLIANRDAVIRSVSVHASVSGERNFLLLSGQDTISEFAMMLDSGTNIVNLDFALAQGNYVLITDEKTNEIQLGTRGPQLLAILDQSGTQYPYFISDLITITGSEFGSRKYNYFFDWLVEPYYEPCVYGPSRFCIELDTTVSIDDFIEPQFSLYPNPSDGRISLLSHNIHFDAYTIIDIQGRLVQESILDAVGSKIELDVTSLLPGTYFILLAFKNRIVPLKFIIR